MPKLQKYVYGKEIFTSLKTLVLLIAVIYSHFTHAQQQDENGNVPDESPPTQVQQRQPAQSYNRHMGVNDEFEAGPAKIAGPNDDLKGQCASQGGSQIGSESNGIRCAIPDGAGGQKEFFYTKHGVKPVDDDYSSAQMANCLNGHCKKNEPSESSEKSLGRYMGQEDKNDSSSQQSSPNNTTTQSTPSNTNSSSYSSSSDDDTVSSSSSSNNSFTNRAPSGDDLQKGLNDCAQATAAAESTCDEYSNKDLSSFNSGASRLLSMIAGRGGVAGNCAFNGAMAALTPGITAAVTSQCAAAYYSCSSTCSQATAASASQPAFVTAIAAYKSRCESLSKKTNSFTSSVQGVGNSVRAAYDCQKQLANNNDCMKDPIKCIFGNSDCSTPQSRQNNPACFCQYTNPNDPMCAIVNKMQDPNSSSDLASTTSLSSKLSADTPAALPLTRQPSSADEPPNPAEALLANSKPQPVGTVELQGKSGDGLSGASGAAGNPGMNAAASMAQAKASAANAKATAVHSGWMAATLGGPLPVPPNTSQDNYAKAQFGHYYRRIKKRFPKMSAEEALRLAHKSAIEATKRWLLWQEATSKGAPATDETWHSLKKLSDDWDFQGYHVMPDGWSEIFQKLDRERFERENRELGFFEELEQNKMMKLTFYFMLTSLAIMLLFIPIILKKKKRAAQEAQSENIVRDLCKDIEGTDEKLNQYKASFRKIDYQELGKIDFQLYGKHAPMILNLLLVELIQQRNEINACLEATGRQKQQFVSTYFDLIVNTLKTVGNKDDVDVMMTPEYKAQIERRKNYKLYTYELDMFVRWKYQKPVPKKVLLSNKHYNSDYYYMIKDQIVPTLTMFHQLKEIF